MIKKFIVIACTVILSLSLVPQGFAEEAIFALEERPQCIKSSKVIGEEIISEDNAFYSVRTSSQDGKSLYDVLEDGMRAHQEEIDINRFGYTHTYANKQIILGILSRVIYENYDILSFTGYYPVVSDGMIVGIKPCYLFDSYQTDLVKRSEMDNVINGYIEMAEGVPDDAGKLLVIHDAFSAENEYATEELAVFEAKNNVSELTYDDMVIFTSYGALINNRSVCQGISITFAAIYNKLGIETGFCESDEKNHIWNVVKIDGKWYQLDATWNDSGVIIGTDEQGNNILAKKCFHDYFLVSDASMEDHGNAELWEYYTADGEVSCSDTTYERGQIYSGDYVYEGHNYGTWYGSVSYRDGRYVIDVWAIPQFVETEGKVMLCIARLPEFFAAMVKSCGMLATDVYAVETENGEQKRVTLFVNEDSKKKTEVRYAVFQRGAMKKAAKIYEFALHNATEIINMSIKDNLPVGGKLFYWEYGTMEPVSRAVEYN